jgi:hypothetical protein
MGLSGPGWAGAGAGRAFGLGPNREDKICFLEIIFNAKTIPENLEIILRARKILEKFQKFQEKSQR